ncbi:hypothetical protein [Thalassospira sp.]|uniref:hypothetical protein n=1 Tax=Thalassospira sp. TaxID=1912094 RepID=UPI000C42AD41|nr:hypothetical protein [Thalassospira sp.]MBC05951.1 hypothetical protein [Thalassospira sp.]|tara:strand:- start:1500 stop:2024 length:525 start_codon:yes stop_codon:yes gene_type:complete
MRDVTRLITPGETAGETVSEAADPWIDHWTNQSSTGREVSVLVVFADAPEKRLLRVLKPGFRHCFVLVSGVRAGEWICLDPQSHRVRCESWCYSPIFDPAAYYRGLGYHCIWARYPASISRKVQFGPMSCVELVKRLLGISAIWIITPWQLYRHLQKGLERDQIGDVFFSEKCS